MRPPLETPPPPSPHGIGSVGLHGAYVDRNYVIRLNVHCAVLSERRIQLGPQLPVGRTSGGHVRLTRLAFELSKSNISCLDIVNTTLIKYLPVPVECEVLKFKGLLNEMIFRWKMLALLKIWLKIKPVVVKKFTLKFLEFIILRTHIRCLGKISIRSGLLFSVSWEYRYDF